jgi:hypothetical protein
MYEIVAFMGRGHQMKYEGRQPPLKVSIALLVVWIAISLGEVWSRHGRPDDRENALTVAFTLLLLCNFTRNTRLRFSFFAMCGGLLLTRLWL